MKNLYVSLFLIFAMMSFNVIEVKGESGVKNSDAIKLYEEKEEIVQVFNYKDRKIYISENDIYLMSQVVYAESRAEPFNGKVAVASVILNRLLHPGFPKTVVGVIKQKGAFSCIIQGKINVIPSEECYSAVVEALKGKDPTSKAVFFYNPKIATSKWMINIQKDNIIPIGNHVFFAVNQ